VEEEGCWRVLGGATSAPAATQQRRPCCGRRMRNTHARPSPLLLAAPPRPLTDGRDFLALLAGHRPHKLGHDGQVLLLGGFNVKEGEGGCRGTRYGGSVGGRKGQVS
jgi:hypothetical protein